MVLLDMEVQVGLRVVRGPDWNRAIRMEERVMLGQLLRWESQPVMVADQWQFSGTVERSHQVVDVALRENMTSGCWTVLLLVSDLLSLLFYERSG